MRESKFSQNFGRVLRERGALVYPLVAGLGVPSGWPDRLVWHRRWAGLVELKAAGTVIEPQQLAKLRDLHAMRPGQAVWYRQREGQSYAGDVGLVGSVEPILVEEDVDMHDLLDVLHEWEAKCNVNAKPIL